VESPDYLGYGWARDGTTRDQDFPFSKFAVWKIRLKAEDCAQPDEKEF